MIKTGGWFANALRKRSRKVVTLTANTSYSLAFYLDNYVIPLNTSLCEIMPIMVNVS